MADGWDIATNIINLASRLPIERLVRRNPEKDLDNFEKRLRDKGLLTPTTAPKMTETAPETQSETIATSRTEKVAQSGSTGIVTRQGLDPETMRWQLGLARADLWDLEGHLKNKCLDCGKDVDCCWKHGQNLINNHAETVSMTTDPMWGEIVELAKEVKMKAHPEHIKRGTYFNEFPQLVLKASELRRKVDTQLIELERPKPSLEEVKKAASEEAAKRAAEAYLKEA